MTNGLWEDSIFQELRCEMEVASDQLELGGNTFIGFLARFCVG